MKNVSLLVAIFFAITASNAFASGQQGRSPAGYPDQPKETAKRKPASTDFSAIVSGTRRQLAPGQDSHLLPPFIPGTLVRHGEMSVPKQSQISPITLKGHYSQPGSVYNDVHGVTEITTIPFPR